MVNIDRERGRVAKRGRRGTEKRGSVCQGLREKEGKVVRVKREREGRVEVGRKKKSMQDLLMCMC